MSCTPVDDSQTYLVRDPDYSDEGTPIQAYYPDDAAEKYAKDHNDECQFLDNDDKVLEVTHPDGKVSYWRTWGAVVHEFYSRETDENGVNL